MSRNAVAIFVKTPGLTPLKTRLAQDIGEENALKFYRLSLAAIEETLKHTGIKAYWAVGEQKGLDDPLWGGFDRLYTGTGELGERQHNIYSRLQETHQNVALIGADCPQITPHILQSAFALMQDYDFVIGPASDGGYYLFLGSTKLPLKSWTNVTYSQQYTRKQLIHNLPKHPTMLHELSDVDHKKDLYRVIKEMPTTPSAQQKALINWIKTLT